MNIVEDASYKRPTFGRKDVADVPVAKQPVPADLQSAVAYAAQFPSAEAYARDTNPIFPMNTDPEHIHRRYADMHRELVAKWNKFRAAGWL
jgi:hypothetical protein